MGVPFTPTRRRPILGAVPSINRAHPLAKGLVGCYVPGPFPNGTIPNLASLGSGDLTVRTGGIVNGGTMDGPGLDMSGTGNINIASTNTPIQLQLTPPVSLFVRGKWTGWPTANLATSLLTVLYNAAPFIAYGLGASAASGNGSAANAPCFFADNGTTSFSNNYGGTVSLVNGAMFSAGVTLFPVLNGFLFYTNGSNATNGPPNFTPTFNHYSLSPTISMGSGVAGRTGAAIVTVGYIWNRFLSAKEHRYMDANPYSLLTWPTDIVYDPQSVPAAITPTSSPSFQQQQPIFSPLTLAGAGAAVLGARAIIRNPTLTRRGALLGRWRRD